MLAAISSKRQRLESDSTFLLTKEQQCILSTVRSPGEIVPAVRVTAGAGTGKTTTLEALSRALYEAGHNNIQYITFSKTQAEDAKRRLQTNILADTKANTLDSLALKLSSFNPEDIVDDVKIRNYISASFKDDILDFLSKMPDVEKSELSFKKEAIRKVSFFIWKTFDQFLKSDLSVENGFEPKDKNVYYPARLYHEKESHLRGLPNFYNAKIFYMKMSRKLWVEFGQPGGKCTHGTIMKSVQLSRVRMSCTALLVDESQDLNQCQLSWILCQHSLHGTHLYVVGDPAQAIFGFRGAKAKNLQAMRKCVDLTLSTSWRFGYALAAVANTLLFCKQHSPHDKDWTPYRLTGRAGRGGQVHTRDLLTELGQGRISGPITVLARTNVELLSAALKALSFSPCGAQGESEDGNANGRPPLKIALNEGKGRAATGPGGGRVWKDVEHLLRDFLAVFSGASRSLPAATCPEWTDASDLDWNGLKEDIKVRELNKYNSVVQLVERFGVQAMSAFRRFKEEVLDAAHSPADPTVQLILSTIHAAKGMEWDRVQLLDEELPDLAKFSITERRPDLPPSSTMTASSLRHQQQQRGQGPGQERQVQFDWKEAVDEFNCWYVGLTRARRELALPQKFSNLVEDFRKMAASAAAGRDAAADPPAAVVAAGGAADGCIRGSDGSDGGTGVDSSDACSALLHKVEDGDGNLGDDSGESYVLCTPSRATTALNAAASSSFAASSYSLDFGKDEECEVSLGGRVWTAREVGVLSSCLLVPWQQEMAAQGGLIIDGIPAS